MTVQLSSGAIVPARRLEAIDGQPVDVPATVGRTHLQFRRYAGCPICHLHLRSFADRHQELIDAGISEVVFFHSPAEELRGYQSILPFTVIADPDKVQYREFGVEKGLRALTHPQTWRSAFRGYAAARRNRGNPDYAGVGSTDGTTHLGLPADFLIDPDGTVVAVHYGNHADDQWSADQVLAIHGSRGGQQAP